MRLIRRRLSRGRREAWEDEGMVGDFWGSQASGVLFRDPTGRFLLLFRSDEVLDPHVWGIPGGAVPVSGAGEPRDLLQSALCEAREEAGYRRNRSVHPRRTFTWRAPTGAFQYTTYLLNTPTFEPELNWESDGWGWFTLSEALALDLHPGVRWVLAQL